MAGTLTISYSAVTLGVEVSQKRNQETHLILVYIHLDVHCHFVELIVRENLCLGLRD